MAETRQPVTVYQIDMQCDQCGTGQMKLDGMAYPTNLMQYEHECNNCGHVEVYRKAYPHFSYEPLASPN